MKALQERILRDGRALDGQVLLVDSFLNHQVDMALMRDIGREFAEHFKHHGADRVLTIESSGIAPAGMAALFLELPLVVLKKKTSRTLNQSLLQTTVQSFTKGLSYEMTAARRFLPAGDRVLFIDDFLAMGEAALGAGRIVADAGCTLAGIGIVIEKSFQPGRERLRALGCEVYALARIGQMSAEKIQFIEEG